jgi:predicted glycoside hydrolase/deacetylase ChbG (UPF0249 family)
MKVIINADDLGYSKAINDEILALMSARKVTSATIMVNGPAFKDAVRRIGHFPNCSFGVHLNLTEFASLTQSQAFHDHGIVDEQGIFTGNFHKIVPSLPLIRAVEKEWTKQIERILDHGSSVSHLDSHHHVHTISWLFAALKAVQRRFKIRKVRTTMNWYYQDEYSPSLPTLVSKRAWNWALQRFYKTITTDHFTSFSWFVVNMREGERRFDGVAELMCHPGQPYASDATALLWSDWAEQLPCSIHKISYSNL